LLADIGALALDRGDHYPVIRIRGPRRSRHPTPPHRTATSPHRLTVGLRRIVEATYNSWFSN
jgi:hypothetical protein